MDNRQTISIFAQGGAAGPRPSRTANTLSTNSHDGVELDMEEPNDPSVENLARRRSSRVRRISSPSPVQGERVF